MREVIRIVAVALTEAMPSLLAAMPIVAGWGTPTGQVLSPPPISPLMLREQAGYLQVQQLADLSMIY